jgi:hypothetical protein
MSRISMLRSLTMGAILAGALAMSGPTVTLAQDETVSNSHPAHVHAGTCDDLEPNPIVGLDNVEPRQNDPEDEDANNDVQGVLTASQMNWSRTDGLELSWDDMLATSHSVNVHESEENIQNYIACGEIGGINVDGSMVIALHPMNDSGYSGIAIIRADGDDNTDIEIYLAAPPTDGAPPVDDEATPAA